MEVSFASIVTYANFGTVTIFIRKHLDFISILKSLVDK